MTSNQSLPRPATTPQVLVQNDDWMIVYKPSGFHTLLARNTEENEREESPPNVSSSRLVINDSDEVAEGDALEAWILKSFPSQAGLPDSGIAHRLDQRTSGCLLVAKTDESYLHLRDDIRSGVIRKIYLAYVMGLCHSDAFTLYFSSRYKRSQKVTVTESGAEKIRGRCRWTMIKTERDRSLLEVELIGRGKRHQIRAGFAHLGHPLIGDRLYGGPSWNERFGLHAWKLMWDQNEITCPPPSDWPDDFAI